MQMFLNVHMDNSRVEECYVLSYILWLYVYSVLNVNPLRALACTRVDKSTVRAYVRTHSTTKTSTILPKMHRSTTNQVPRTPSGNRESNGHYFTPARAKVRGAVEFCERMGIPYFKEDVFRTFQCFAHSRP